MGHRNIFGPVLALEVPLEVALVVEGVVAMRTLVELLLMSCNVPFEQRLARPLFRALRAFKEGFFFLFAPRFGGDFHSIFFCINDRFIDSFIDSSNFLVIVLRLLRHHQSITENRDCISHA